MSFTLHYWLCNQQEICEKESCKCLLEQIFPRIFSNKHLLYALIWFDLNWFRIYFWITSFSEHIKPLSSCWNWIIVHFQGNPPAGECNMWGGFLSYMADPQLWHWSTFEVWANIQGNLWAISLLQHNLKLMKFLQSLPSRH